MLSKMTATILHHLLLKCCISLVYRRDWIIPLMLCSGIDALYFQNYVLRTFEPWNVGCFGDFELNYDQNLAICDLRVWRSEINLVAYFQSSWVHRYVEQDGCPSVAPPVFNMLHLACLWTKLKIFFNAVFRNMCSLFSKPRFAHFCTLTKTKKRLFENLRLIMMKIL